MLHTQRKIRQAVALVQRGEPIIVRPIQVGLKSPWKDKHNTHNKRVLWDRDPHCHWCGIVTYLPAPGERCDRLDGSTVDHVFPKLHPEREARGGEIVLACRACNLRRDLISKIQWRRSAEARWGRIRRVDSGRRAATLARIAELEALTPA